MFRKHNYNPLSGCLPIFIQMPVFIGLYRSLDGRHRAARRPAVVALHPLVLESGGPRHALRLEPVHAGCSSTAASGIFGLGPYFNLLPILTIVLFIVQQKMFMPPAADEQAAMQQKMMKYMMVFMGLMFYKVASGLCIYFIASSLWGLAERRFLPKTAPPMAGTARKPALEAKARGTRGRHGEEIGD